VSEPLESRARESAASAAESVELRGKPRALRSWLAGLLALILLLSTTLWLLRKDAPRSDPSQPDAVVRSDAGTNTADIASLRQRLDDAQKVNALLREQSLALTQRLSLVEDAIANMSRGLAPAASSMKLDEAEYLLSLAIARLELFKDVDRAQRALELADLQLASVNDPRLARVRQTLAIEMDALRAVPRIDTVGIGAKIAALSSKIDVLPVQTAESSSEGRIRQLLDRYLVIRREGELMPTIGRSPWAIREGLRIELERAQLALERKDAAVFTAALKTGQTLAQQALVADAAPVREFTLALSALSEQPIHADLPALGSSLSELRALRNNAIEPAPPVAEPAAADDAASDSPAAPAPPADAGNAVELNPQAAPSQIAVPQPAEQPPQ
jgi:uroporphyrin-III C-methyltransferase